MSDPRFSRSRRRTGEDAHERIAAFLTMDIQQSPDWARALLTKITDVKSGVLPSWERIGNAYHLQLSAQGALIEDLVGPTRAVQRVPLEELEAALTAWIEALG